MAQMISLSAQHHHLARARHPRLPLMATTTAPARQRRTAPSSRAPTRHRRSPVRTTAIERLRHLALDIPITATSATDTLIRRSLQPSVAETVLRKVVTTVLSCHLFQPLDITIEANEAHAARRLVTITALRNTNYPLA